MSSETATDILKCWLVAGDRLAGALDVIDEAHRQSPRRSRELGPLALTAVEVYLIRGLVAEIPDLDAFRKARDTVAAADVIELASWVESMRFTRYPDPVAALIEAWNPVGSG